MSSRSHTHCRQFQRLLTSDCYHITLDGLAVDSNSHKLYFTYVSGEDNRVAVHNIYGPIDDFTDLPYLPTNIQYTELAVDPASG